MQRWINVNYDKRLNGKCRSTADARQVKAFCQQWDSKEQQPRYPNGLLDSALASLALLPKSILA